METQLFSGAALLHLAFRCMPPVGEKEFLPMMELLHFEQIDAMAAVEAVNATLRRIDERLIDHGERVAYLACALRDAGGRVPEEKELFLLSVFHDIGAYKTEEIDRMVEFETHDVLHHAIYGYLFLKYLTPLRPYAEAILYHHTPWSDDAMRASPRGDYGALIHLADRLDIALLSNETDRQVRSLLRNETGCFRPEDVAALQRCLAEGRMLRDLADGSYRLVNKARCAGFLPQTAETLEYLKMVVYAIDFRSEQTVTHTVNTVSLALNIAGHFGLDRRTQEQIYLGALLHDVGKIAIPSSILEYPGRLSDEQMAIMRTHVDETEAIIGAIVPDAICRIAVRHHEKLDGSGYPLGLRAEELTLPSVLWPWPMSSALCPAAAAIRNRFPGKRRWRSSGRCPPHSWTSRCAAMCARITTPSCPPPSRPASRSFADIRT